MVVTGSQGALVASMRPPPLLPGAQMDGINGRWTQSRGGLKSLPWGSTGSKVEVEGEGRET